MGVKDKRLNSSRMFANFMQLALRCLFKLELRSYRPWITKPKRARLELELFGRLYSTEARSGFIC